MPFIFLYSDEASSEEQKQKICEAITLDVAQTFGIPEQAVRIVFQELKESQVSYSGWLKSDPKYQARKADIERTNPYAQINMPVAILYTEEGKTEEQYQEAAKHITRAISNHLNAPEDNVRLIFQILTENRVASGGVDAVEPGVQSQNETGAG